MRSGSAFAGRGFGAAFGLALVLAGSVPARGETLPPRENPLSLADPNGQGLVFEALDVRVAAHGPLALAELEMVFRNPTDRTIEGRFASVLPTGATISRFAKEVGGQLMEGEVVERLKATKIYTEILHTMRDPALLETDQGNRFSARVFPIPPRAPVRLLLAYSQVLPAGPDGVRNLVLPLAGADTIGRFSFTAVCRPLPGEKVEVEGWLRSCKRTEEAGNQVFRDERTREGFRPSEDVRVRFEAGAGAPASYRLRSGDFEMVSFRTPARTAGSDGVPPGLAFWLDTSASQAEAGAHRLRAIAELLFALEPRVKGQALHFKAFDLEVKDLGKRTAGGNVGEEIAEALRARRFLGATNLVRAVTALGEAARAQGAPGRFVLVSDAIPTLGEREAGDLAKALGAWPKSRRLHILVLGSVHDERVARALADAGGGRVVELALVQDLRSAAGAAAAALLRGDGHDLALAAPGAVWVEPESFRDVEPGSEIVAFARSSGGEAPRLSGDATLVGPAAANEVPGFAPLLAREAFRALLGRLERQEGAATDAVARQKLRDERLRISVEERVLCPLTSLLVLETEADYQRFGLDRRALKDIMVVGPEGITWRKRAGEPPPVVKPPPPVRPTTGNKLAEKKKDQDKTTRGPTDAADGFDRDFRDQNGSPEPSQEEAAATATEDEAEETPRSLSRQAQEPSRREAPEADLRSAEREHASFDDAVDSSLEGGASPRGGGGSGRASRADATAPSESRAPMGGELGFVAGSSSGSAPPAPLSQRRPGPGFPGGVGGQPGIAADPPGSMPVPEPPVAPRPPPPPPRPTNPDWVKGAGWKPDPAYLEKLAKAVAAAPHDRRERNKLGWSLQAAGKDRELLEAALDWQAYDPRNPQVYEYLSEALRALEDEDAALRAISSIAEVAPNDSGLLNRAGYLAIREGLPVMAETLFRAALVRRPDHHNNHRGLALALWFQDRHADALEVLLGALGTEFHSRYGNLKRVLREEAQTILHAWAQARPDDTARIKLWSGKLGVEPAAPPPLRFTLAWETDANDVDLHVVDPSGEECFYGHKSNRSGLNLYEDLTQGLGPEVAVVPEKHLQAGTYHVGVKYFRAGPMGVSRGIVLVAKPGEEGRPGVDVHTFTLLPDIEGATQDKRYLVGVLAQP